MGKNWRPLAWHFVVTCIVVISIDLIESLKGGYTVQAVTLPFPLGLVRTITMCEFLLPRSTQKMSSSTYLRKKNLPFVGDVGAVGRGL